VKRIAYYGSRISDHISRTPEGYLVCRDVPIARTGVQEYRGEEFGAPEPDVVYRVTRPEHEVFSPAAMASFEGKPLVDEHPPEDVTADNFDRYMKGVCREVRRGTGVFRNNLMADLIIYDKKLADEVETGMKRDISCGYDCVWEPGEAGAYTQKMIRGNHIAVTVKGRAGRAVAIRDAALRTKGGQHMKNSLWGRILGAFARDAETTPEDMAAAAKLQPVDASDGETPVKHEPAQEQPAPEKPALDAELDARLKKIEDTLASLAEQGNPKEEDAAPDEEAEGNALDNLEEALKGGSRGEKEATRTPGEINAGMSDEEPDAESGLIEPGDEEGRADEEARDSALACIAAMKPVIAAMPDKQRKAAADSIAWMIRGAVQDTGYVKLQKAKRHTGNRSAMDAAVDDYDLGRRIAAKYNPHCKKEV